MLDFEPITILYGGNGSGKTTAPNVRNRGTMEEAEFGCFMMKQGGKI